MTQETWEEAAPENTAALERLRSQGTKSDQSFAELAGNSAVVLGRDLMDKAELIGVPHIITQVAFRPDSKGGAQARDFVSVEATTVDDRAIVYNDSSTGIRRQIVLFLQGHKLLPEGDPDERICAPGNDPETVSQTFELGAGQKAPTLGVRRGLRVSHYDHPEYGEADTYYLS